MLKKVFDASSTATKCGKIMSINQTIHKPSKHVFF